MSDKSEKPVVCESCNRRYVWKPEWAGRKVKCKCGESMWMPDEDPLASPKEPAPSEPLVTEEPPPDPNKIACPGCGKSYTWKADFAGKEVKCKCGCPFLVPDAPGKKVERADQGYGLIEDQALPAAPKPEKKPTEKLAPKPAASRRDKDDEENEEPEEEAGAYNVTEDAPPAPKKGGAACPSCSKPLAAGSVLCLECGFHLKLGKKLSASTAAEAPPDPDAGKWMPGENKDLKAYVIPGILLGVSILGYLLGLYLLTGSKVTELAEDGGGFSPSYIALAIGFLVSLPIRTAIITVACLISVKVVGCSFGSIPSAILKFAAISATYALISVVVNYLLAGGGFLIEAVVAYSCYAGFMYWLFDFDGFEASTTAVICMVVEMIAGFAVLYVISSMVMGL